MAPIPPGSALATAAPPALSLQVRSVDDLARLARVFAASGLFGRNGNQETQIAECAIRLMAGMEAGFSPFASATGIHIIEGKPAFSSNLLAQAVRRHPVYDYRVMENTASVCRIQFTANGQPLGVSEFTIEMAKRAGLATKSIWQKYPEAMLFSRALTAGMRTHCPDALNGAVAYTPEELGAPSRVDENGVVVATVTEELPARDQLQAQALRRLKDSGLTTAGMRQMLSELAGPDATGLGQLSDDVLSRLARAGASAETIARWNAAKAPEPERAMTVLDVDGDPVDIPVGPDGEDPDDLPAAWAAD